MSNVSLHVFKLRKTLRVSILLKMMANDNNTNEKIAYETYITYKTNIITVHEIWKWLTGTETPAFTSQHVHWKDGKMD